jgi:hypothetical protein
METVDHGPHWIVVIAGHKQKIPLVGMETLNDLKVGCGPSIMSQTENPARRDGNW